MASELITTAEADATIYAIVLNAIGQVWNTVSLAFEAIVDASWASYDIGLTEQGTSSGIYVGSMPVAITTPATYTAIAYRQSGASPAVSDTKVSSGRIQWGGTSELVASSLTAAQVWEYATRTLTSASVQVVTPFQTGHKTIVRGDSYLNEDGKAIVITKANGVTWPSDLASLPWTISVKFEPSDRLLIDMPSAANVPTSGTIAGTVVSASSVRFDLTKAQSEPLTLNTVNRTSGNSHSYNYAVLATTGSKQVALEIGTITVVDDLVTS